MREELRRELLLELHELGRELSLDLVARGHVLGRRDAVAGEGLPVHQQIQELVDAALLQRRDQVVEALHRVLAERERVRLVVEHVRARQSASM